MASKSEGKRLLEEDEEIGSDDKRLKSEGKFSFFLKLVNWHLFSK